MEIQKNREISLLIPIIRQEVGQAMLQWGQVVVSHASAHAPILEGALRRSLTVSDVEVVGDTLRVRVGPDASVSAYAPRQELDESLGFGKLSLAEGATRPWLRPAFDMSKTLGNALVRGAFARAVQLFK